MSEFSFQLKSISAFLRKWMMKYLIEVHLFSSKNESENVAQHPQQWSAHQTLLTALLAHFYLEGVNLLCK